MRWAWPAVFAAGCSLAFWAGRVTAPDRAPAVRSAGASVGTAPLVDDRPEPSAPAARPPNAADRKRSGRAPVRPAHGGAVETTDLVARITALVPDGAPDPVAPTIVPRSPAEMATAVRAFLARSLSLDRGGGRNLRGLLERFLIDCPDEPLDRDDVFRFAWQDGTGIGWQLVHHLPREEATKWFESFLTGGPPMQGASLGAKRDGTQKLFDDVFAAFPARGQAAVIRAMDDPDTDVRQLAVNLALRRTDLFAPAILAKASGDDDVVVRSAALTAARALAENGDADRRAAVQRAVLGAAGASELELRQTAFALLDLAGSQGMAIARELLDRGGLAADEEVAVIGSLVRGGRAADVLAATMSETRVAALIEAAGEAGENHELLADLARRAAEVPCPAERDLAGSWASLMAELGHAEVAIAAVRTPSRAAAVRASVLQSVLEPNRAESARAAVACAGDLLADAASPTDLRRALVDVLVNSCGDAARPEALDVLRRAAAADANAAIRSAAAAGVRALATN